jgi:N-acetylglucosaminyldiphosphoundecaprenol N-acetyl-beta-D-mannosaminyltransferase
MYSKANVLGVGIDAVDMDQALECIAEELTANRKGYVCFAGVHGVMEAQRSPELAKVMADAAFVMPDGMPAVWVGRHQGNDSMRRVFGPDLMLEVLRRGEFCHCTHFFCGGKAGVAEELRDRMREHFPHVKIVGVYTPPFGPMSPAEEGEFIGIIKELHPDVVWIGMSTPKQERFMAQYLPLLDTRLMFGVGAAFDYHTGRISDCADWIKRCGLQWFHRLLQDPKHLWKRYLLNNPVFMWAVALQLTGLRAYPIQPKFGGSSATPGGTPSIIETQSR